MAVQGEVDQHRHRLPNGTDAPICQDTPSGGLDVLLTTAEVGHDSLVDLSREEAFQAADDVAFGPASGDASGGVGMRLVTDWPPRIVAPSWSGWADRTVMGRGYSRPLWGHGPSGQLVAVRVASGH